eukprot:COSAG02_NODE_10923_length_1831_cov_1.228060_2_plen_105_part_00
MFTVIVHIHSLSSQFFHKSRFQLYSTCHDERAAHANRNLAFSFTSPAENQVGWCGDYMEYGPNWVWFLTKWCAGCGVRDGVPWGVVFGGAAAAAISAAVAAVAA